MPKPLVPALILSTLLSACGTESTPLTAAHSALGPRTESEALCLAQAPAQVPAAIDLQHSQRQAQRRPNDSMVWVAGAREWVRIARQSLDPGFYLNVDACAERALQNQPDLVAALEIRSLVLLSQHQFEPARALAERILQIDEHSVLALGSLSDALLELGRFEAAAAAAQRLMDIQPGMAANTRGSWLRWLRGDVEGAKRMIRDALFDRDARDPEAAAWAFSEAAALYWQQGDYAGAQRLYGEALRWQADYPAALLGRSRAELAQGNTRTSIDLLVKAESILPSVEVLWLLGDAYQLSGDAVAAEASYRRAEQIGRRGDHLNLAAFLAARDRHPEQALALIEAERAVRGGIYLDDTYAWTLHRLGRDSEARRAIEHAMRLGTRDARLLYHAGAIRIALGDAVPGRALIEQALALNPQFDPIAAEHARHLLATAGKLAAH